jgi:outer membrane immunogenic protein
MKTIKALGCTGLLLCATFSVGIPSIEAADLTEAAPSWTGPYIGVNIGYGWDSGEVDFSPYITDPTIEGLPEALQDLLAAGSYPDGLSPDAEGILGGGQIGYNWQLSSAWVVGIEADLQASDIDGSKSEHKSPLFFDETETSASKQVDWFGTLRARAGFLVNPQWLLFVTGGLAYGKTSLSFKTADISQGCVFSNLCADETSSGVKAGWTVGAGTELMLAQDWSLKAEYLYVDLGERSFNAESMVTDVPVDFDVSANFHEHIARLGLNYHFN